MEIKQIPTGTITLRIEGISREETERYREIIQTLILSGGLNIKAGKVIMNFDENKNLREVELSYKSWKR